MIRSAYFPPGGTTSYVNSSIHRSLPLVVRSNKGLDIYTAATVLIAGLLHRAVLSELTEESVSQSWRRAIQILQKYQRYSSSAQRCIVALELLYEQVSSSSAAPAGSQHHSPAPHDPAHDLSLGEGLSAAVLDSFDMPEFFDMSWLNSVPSNLH